MAALPCPPSSSSSSSSESECSDDGDVLDLVEVISVGSSSDEDDEPVVVPLNVLVKREQTDECSPVTVKSELRPVAPHDAGFLVDLCSDDSDSDDDNRDRPISTNGKRTSVSTRLFPTGGFTYELVTDPVEARDGGLIVRFKRRKTGHETSTSSRSAGVCDGGGAEDVAAAAAMLSSDSDTEAYASDSDADDEDADTEEDNDTEDDDNSDGTEDHSVDHSPALSSSLSHSLTRPQVDAIILADMQKLEARKPWRFVYRCLEVPFHVDRSIDAFDLLFERWDAFWKVCGRAVWERYFWAPLPVGTLEYQRRKYRQWRAARLFRALALELYEKLGPGLLRQVIRQAHDGWWYRSPPLVLRELFNLDPRKYGMYLTLCRERFPRGSNFERSLDAAWCLDSVELAGVSSSSRGCDKTGELDLAQKAWQEVVRSDDDDCDSANDDE